MKKKNVKIKRYLKARDEILKQEVHSELIIERPDGLDRCSLILISYDTPQLKEIRDSLQNRGVESELFEDFYGGKQFLSLI